MVAFDTAMTAPFLSSSPEVRAQFEQQVPMGRIAAAEEIGRVVRFLLSDEASYITGVTLPVTGGR